MEEKLTFRYARREDAKLILEFIKALAEYEKMSDEVVANEQLLEEWIFDKQTRDLVWSWMERKSALLCFFHNFSTFLGRAGLVPGGPVRAAGIQGQGLLAGLC